MAAEKEVGRMVDIKTTGPQSTPCELSRRGKRGNLPASTGTLLRLPVVCGLDLRQDPHS